MSKSIISLAVGTKSEQKIGYLKEVLSELGVEAKLSTYKAESNVSEQPITSKETLTGAKNRAIAAIKSSESDFGIGIEVGYDRDENGEYEMFCWAVIVDESGNEVSKARSHSFLLPHFHNSVLKNEKYLGDFVKEYFAVSDDAITQYVAEVLRSRKLFIVESVRYALIYALHKEFYKQ
jgi:non-canonical (house-cleaning) NTP pyrophosphatase